MTAGDDSNGHPAGFEEQEKYILFSLAGETYCIPILKAQEIISDFTLTQFPNLPDFYHGVISLRGDAIPVINLRGRFNLADQPMDDRTRVIIVELDEGSIGMLVDEVLRVVNVPRGQIDLPPKLRGGQTTPYITGVTELEHGKFCILLDIDEILTSMEKIDLVKVRDSIVQTLSQSPEGISDVATADDENKQDEKAGE